MGHKPPSCIGCPLYGDGRGFVPDEMFAGYLGSVDIVANLRYPSMGESSGLLIQAMAFDKPVIVTNHAFASEFPDDVVAKVSCGENEIDEIANVLQKLVENEGERDQLGVAARRYVETHCAPDKVANLYLDICQNSPNSRVPDGKEQIAKQAVAPS